MKNEVKNHKKFENAAKRAGEIAFLENNIKMLRQQGKEADAKEVEEELEKLLGY